ncbi:MAG TPA: CPBP family intramembrane glutamic endopeptidase [Arenimonas sp.]|nr:CPBP family intramembrane glutamic endopeptidase [Arenimonas sp.]
MSPPNIPPVSEVALRERILTILEIVAVYAGGAVLGVLLAKLAGVELRNPMLAIAENPEQNLLPIAGDLAVLLLWQYFGWLLCASALRGVRGRLEAVRGDGARVAPGRLLFLGLVVACLVTLPQHSIGLAQHYLGLGEMAPWRAALLASQWDMDFWVLMAVGSFGLIPLIEEAFYRGWMLSRLRHALHPGLAVLFTAGLFALSHSQYLRWDALNLLTLASIIFGGGVYALVTIHARSLWPAILAHAVINVPLTPTLEWLQLAVMAVFLWLTWPVWADFRAAAAKAFAGLSWRKVLAALLGGGALALALSQFQELMALVGLTLWLGLLAYYAHRRWRKGSRVPVGQR